MLTQERYQEILQLVESKGAVTVSELVEEIGTSESTIRRDLSSLHLMGKLKKVHGGATALTQEYISDEYDVNTKSGICVGEKTAIARYAASTIQEEDFVYIDAGTSTQILVDYITCKKAIYVTNGIVHAKKLIAKGMKTYLVGGLVKPVTEAIIGAEGVNSIQKYNFTKAFMGTNGVHVDSGFTTVDAEEALMKKAAMEHSYMSYVLADHTKFDKVTAVTFAPIEKACIITDALVNDKYKQATLIKEVAIV